MSQNICFAKLSKYSYDSLSTLMPISLWVFGGSCRGSLGMGGLVLCYGLEFFEITCGKFFENVVPARRQAQQRFLRHFCSQNLAVVANAIVAQQSIWYN